MLTNVGMGVQSVAAGPIMSASLPHSPVMAFQTHLPAYQKGRPATWMSTVDHDRSSRLATGLLTKGLTPSKPNSGRLSHFANNGMRFGLRQSSCLMCHSQIEGETGGHAPMPDAPMPAFRKDDHWQALRGIVEEQCRISTGSTVNVEAIERAMQQWFEQLKQKGDAVDDALVAIGHCLEAGDELEYGQFKQLYKKIGGSDSEVNLLVELATLLRFNRLVTWLLIEGVPDANRVLALMIHSGNDRGVECYLSNKPLGMDINSLTEFHDEPWAEAYLHKAVKMGSLDVVRQLLCDDQIDVDRQDENGDTPLSKATLVGNAEMTKLLLSYGANPLQQNHVGESPLSITVESMAAKASYDIQHKLWGFAIDEDAPQQSGEIMKLLVLALDRLDCVDTEHLDQVLLRLISSDVDQRESIIKIFQVRKRGVPKGFLCCDTQKVLEPIFAVGHEENIATALGDLKAQLGSKQQQQEYIKAHQRDDLHSLLSEHW